MSNSAMQLDLLDHGIAFITFDLRHSKVNTLGLETMSELNELIEKIKADSSIKGLVFSSGKHESFIAGADVNEIQKLQGQSQYAAFEAAQMGKDIFAKIAVLPINTVAAINGVCLGGGAELALSCKYRIAAKKAKIGLPEIKLGFVPGWGGCIRLPKLVGLAKSLDLIMSGKVLNASKAWKIGLVSEVVEDKELLARAIQVARDGNVKYAPRPLQEEILALLLEHNSIGRDLIRNTAYKAMMRQTKGKYPAPKEALPLIIQGFSMPEDKAFELESRAFAKLAMTKESRNLVNIFFAQQESKRLPVEVEKEQKPKIIGVLGAGVMGSGIAQAAAKAGCKVILKDVNQEFVDKGKAHIVELFDSLVTKRKMSREEADKTIGDMIFTTEYEPLKGCDLVIEAVLEDIKVKKAVLAELEKVNKKPFIFGSNTSSLSLAEIGADAREPARVVGIHFFNPVHKMPLVEIVRGPKTTEETLAIALDFAMSLDKTTVVTADSPGFVVNRILAPYLREAAVLMEEGVPVEDIDKAMKSFGMPMGPFLLLDEIGLDIATKVIHVMHAALGERFSEPEILTQIKNLKLLGKKGGKGVYLYDEKEKPAGINPDVQACVKKQAKKQQGEIRDRLVLLMVNEAARCLEEGIVKDPSQLDLAMIFGTGFPPFEGGILRYADSVGIKIIVQKLSLLAQVQGFRYEPCSLLQTMDEQKLSFYA
ncbi:MAG: enoyl-CoA hydratase/isomerase family protein [Candidatus Obscuribacterales bacterium]|nr:enoyl-CoA hydratase/isomerase family protein [Candidatus Obscuribacterales bacterium]